MKLMVISVLLLSLNVMAGETKKEERKPANDDSVTVVRVQGSQMTKAEKWMDRNGNICYVVGIDGSGNAASISCVSSGR